MKKTDLSRRDFTRLSMAALGGVAAGSLLGCGDGGTPTTDPGTPPANTETPPAAGGAEAGAEGDVTLLMEEPNVCRGLNMCMNKGASKENACAGQGTCASVEAHACAGANKCKGQGGCAADAGRNACEGKGSCEVPLMDKAWTSTREAFEKAMKAAEKEVGPAPPKA